MNVKYYSLEDLTKDGRQIYEAYDYGDFYYVITFDDKKRTVYWKVNKSNREVVVSSWPSMLTETKGKISGMASVSGEAFLNKINA